MKIALLVYDCFPVVFVLAFQTGLKISSLCYHWSSAGV